MAENESKKKRCQSLTDGNNFGDLLGIVMKSLPNEASSQFLQALAGLDADESCDLCRYIQEMQMQKKYRVIQAMSDSSISGKKKFIQTLRQKMAIKKEAEKAQQAKEAFQKNPKAVLQTPTTKKEAHERVKRWSNSGNKFHSSSSLFATDSKPGGKQSGEKVSRRPPIGPPFNPSKLKLTDPEERRNAFLASRHAKSSSAVIEKEITKVGQMLVNAHINQSSEVALLNLEKRGHKPDAQEDAASDPKAAMEFMKRERPKSNLELLKDQESEQQRQRKDEKELETSMSELRRISNTSSSGSVVEVPKVDPSEAPTSKRWTKAQDAALRASVQLHGEKNWKAIAEHVPGRNHAQCLQRWRKVLKPGLVKGHWSYEEDQILEALVRAGNYNWGQVAEQITGRTPKQCRERWRNHLDPSINKGPYMPEEDAVILEAQERLGNKWSQIAQMLKGRTEDSVKIRWKSLKQNPAKAQSMNRARSIVNGWQKKESAQGASSLMPAPVTPQSVSQYSGAVPDLAGINPMMFPYQQQQQQSSPANAYMHQQSARLSNPPPVTGNPAFNLNNLNIEPTAYNYGSKLEPSNDMYGFKLGQDNDPQMQILFNQPGFEQQFSTTPSTFGQQHMGQSDFGVEPDVNDLDDLVNSVNDMADDFPLDLNFEAI